MTLPEIMVLGLLAATMALFIFSSLRHDIVALIALLAAVLIGLVPAADAFAGFSQPAVITVACVLVLSRMLQQTGAVETVSNRLLPAQAGRTVSMFALVGLGAFLSAFMNNVGALALLMPVAIRVAARLEMPAGQILMPLSFGTILGGMTTLIGTPPNLIVSGIRAEAGLGEYQMFDLTPVGLPVALAGVVVLVLFGWRLVPGRDGAGAEVSTGLYLTEVRVAEKSTLIGGTLHEAEEQISESGSQVVGLVRNGVHLFAPRGSRAVQAGDILVVETELEEVPELLGKLGLALAEGEQPPATAEDQPADPDAEDTPDTPKRSEIILREVVVMPGAALAGRSPRSIQLRNNFSINLLALSRSGHRRISRLSTAQFQSGDLLLVQGDESAIARFCSDQGCMPLATREIDLPDRANARWAMLIMGAALVAVTAGLLPTAIAFLLAVVAAVVFGILPLRQLYTSIDWTVVVLLAALIPIAGAMEQTGAAASVATALVGHVAGDSVVIGLVLVLVLTMFLSDVMNNAATAAVMAPIGMQMANQLGASVDQFLLAVAIGASCAFLTPIGHQNNTLILGPGGFRFGDYWKAGLLLELAILPVAVIMLMLVW